MYSLTNSDKSEKWSSMIELMPIAFSLYKIVLNDDGIPYDLVIIDINPKFEELFGILGDDLKGNRITQIIPDIDKHWLELVFQVYNSGESAFLESFLTPAKKYLEVKAYRTTDNNVACLYEDVTIRINRQRELEEKEGFIKGIIDTIPNFIYIYDVTDFRMVFTNDSVKGVIGYKPNELIEMGPKVMQKIMHTDDLPVMLEKIDRIIASIDNDEYYDNEYRIKHKSGRWVWVHDRAIPYERDESGRITKVIGSVNDITSRKVIENALEENANRFKSIVDNSAAGYFFIDKAGYFRTVNNAWLNMYKFKNQSDVINIHYSELLFDEDKEFEERAFKNVLNYDIISNRVVARRCSDGSRGFNTYSANPVVKYNQVIGIEGFILDTTQRINHENEQKELIIALKLSKELTEDRAKEIEKLNFKLLESEKILKELNANKDKFFSIIAHDLKSPFQGFLGLTKLLSSQIDDLDKNEIQELAEDMNKSANHLFKLLENLLHWSRIQRGVIEYTPEEFDLYILVDLAFGLLNEVANHKKISLINNVPHGIRVYSDQNFVDTIIRNITSNAIKFSNYGGRIEISAELNGAGTISVKIKDNGIGMDSKTIGSLFKIETQQSQPGTANEHGTGLGLILCKELIDLAGSKIWAESKLDEGSTFYFTLSPAIDRFKSN